MRPAPLTFLDESFRPTPSQQRYMIVDVMGGVWHTRPWVPNILMIRNDKEPKASYTGAEEERLHLPDGRFNDLCCLTMTTPAGILTRYFRATTDPGYPWRKDPNRGGGGVGALVEGFHLYRLGYHGRKNPRRAFVLVGGTNVYRDADFDKTLTLDLEQMEKGWGFNFHRRRGSSTWVGRWSGGCLVLYLEVEFEEVLGYVDNKLAAGHGDHQVVSLCRASWFEDWDLAHMEYDRIAAAAPVQFNPTGWTL